MRHKSSGLKNSVKWIEIGEFDVRLIAPEKEIRKESGLKTIQNMESEKVRMQCKTKPPTPTGKACFHSRYL